MPILEFRRQCREFAAHWVAVQTEEFKRLAWPVIGKTLHPMTFAAEATIANEIGKFLMNVDFTAATGR